MPTLSSLWKSTNEADWFKALENYWNYVQPRNLQVEKQLDSLDPYQVEKMDSKHWYRFLHDIYFVWKFTQPNVCVANQKHLANSVFQNGYEPLNEIKRDLFAFDRESIEAGLNIVIRIHGLSIKAGSGLLAILFPQHFATLDQFLIKALKEIDEYQNDEIIQRMNPDQPTKNNGIYLINLLRKKAIELNTIFKSDFWTPRKLDMILWTHGRD